MKQLIFIVAITCAVTSVAFGQPADPSAAAKVPVARRQYDEGLEAASKGRWSMAYERFKSSYELAPRVLTLFNLAGAQAATGRLVEATESYRRFLRETADGRYPDYRTDATKQLEELERQISHVTLEVINIDPRDVIAIDESEFPHAALGEQIPMNPGQHVAQIRRTGAVVASRTITLTPGSAETVRLEVPVKPVDLNVQKPEDPPPTTGATFDTGPRPEQPERSRSVLRSPWLWSAVALVVVGGAAGAYFFTRSDDEVLVVR